MNPLELRAIGRTNLRVPCLGMGGGTLGDMRVTISEAQSDATVAAAWEAGIRFFDTAPFYGHTKSEHRLGRVLRTYPRDEYVLTTKVGRVYFRPGSPEEYRPGGWSGGLPFNYRFDYTRAGLLRSYEDSIQRLGVPRVDALLIHDLDPGAHGSEEAVNAGLDQLETGGFAALRELRARGEIGAVGVGINRMGMVPRFLERFDPDFFLIAMPYTLLNQDALDLELPLCEEGAVGVVIGAPFATGLLAAEPDRPTTYGYRPAAPEMVEKTRRIAAVCARHAVPLGAAALQFPLAHPSVAAVIPGPHSPEEARKSVDWMRAEIPPAFWSDLRAEGLVRADAPLP